MLTASSRRHNAALGERPSLPAQAECRGGHCQQRVVGSSTAVANTSLSSGWVPVPPRFSGVRNSKTEEWKVPPRSGDAIPETSLLAQVMNATTVNSTMSEITGLTDLPSLPFSLDQTLCLFFPPHIASESQVRNRSSATGKAGEQLWAAEPRAEAQECPKGNRDRSW